MEKSQSSSGSLTEKLIDFISPILAPLGYEVVHLEVHTHRQKTLRLFIDFVSGDKVIGVEDCAAVSRALDEPLDQLAEIERTFGGAYELEVSSPGVDRPLRLAKDYERFKGHELRVHTFRPLTTDEIGNAEYQAKNPKQKNFLGTLKGLENGQVLLSLAKDGSVKKNGRNAKKPDGNGPNPATEEIRIPLSLISKANLEPNFEFDAGTKASEL